MDSKPLIIDCDPGKDDAVALLLAFASPELDLLAITTVSGNVPLAKTAANARRICELGGRSHIPVHAGCPRPIMQPLETATHVHGEDGLAGADLPPPTMALADGHAVDVLIERLMARNDITLAVLGPMTNVALAIIKQPNIVPRIREIVFMGGGVGVGNVTPYAEFNLYCDPHAAAVVMGAGAPLIMIGLDVTHQARATALRLAAFAAIGNRPANIVAGMLGIHRERGADAESGEIGAPLHDPCVIAYLLRPDLFQTEAMHVTVETADPERLGETVATAPGPDQAANVNVVRAIDADGFFALLAERLARL
jgi:purine nucleosidase